MLAAALLALAALAAPASAVTLAKVYENCVKANTVALTFDDGPYIYETKLSQTLTNAGIKATFFVNGNNYRCIYDQAMVTSVKAAYAAGHEFGSHTWHHADLATLAWDPIHDEMWRTELALQRIIGVNPAIMRPPYGSYNDLVRQASALRNQSMVTWDFDSGDSVGATPQQSKDMYTQVANQHPSNLLALNHEVYETTVDDVIPFAITTLKNKGYKFVTVSECLGIPAYQWVASPQTRTSDWNCDI